MDSGKLPAAIVPKAENLLFDLSNGLERIKGAIEYVKLVKIMMPPKGMS